MRDGGEEVNVFFAEGNFFGGSSAAPPPAGVFEREESASSRRVFLFRALFRDFTRGARLFFLEEDERVDSGVGVR